MICLTYVDLQLHIYIYVSYMMEFVYTSFTFNILFWLSNKHPQLTIVHHILGGHCVPNYNDYWDVTLWTKIQLLGTHAWLIIAVFPGNGWWLKPGTFGIVCGLAYGFVCEVNLWVLLAWTICKLTAVNLQWVCKWFRLTAPKMMT